MLLLGWYFQWYSIIGRMGFTQCSWTQHHTALCQLNVTTFRCRWTREISYAFWIVDLMVMNCVVLLYYIAYSLARRTVLAQNQTFPTFANVGGPPDLTGVMFRNQSQYIGLMKPSGFASSTYLGQVRVSKTWHHTGGFSSLNPGAMDSVAGKLPAADG